jgi:L-threonylcarbamoyladenylate synthase
METIMATQAERAAQVLRMGGLVALPTETVYGLAGDAMREDALARIFEVKGRPRFDPLILHVASADLAWELAREVPDLARRLANAFWPGPLTLVVPKQPRVSDLATSGLPNVALRVPAHPLAQRVLMAFGGPLAAPSANRFGRISPTTAAAVRAELGSSVDLILDGGPCEIGLESTVIGFDRRGPWLLRAGGISIEDIEAIAGHSLRRARSVETAPLAPGQLMHHYAPGKPLLVVRDEAELCRKSGPGAGVLALSVPHEIARSCAGAQSLAPDGNLATAAARFFDALRTLDETSSVRYIVAVRLPHHNLGIAMNERLERAQSPQAEPA